MKNMVFATLLASLFFGAGLWAGCSSETSVDFSEEGAFSCVADRECLGGFECSSTNPEESGVCVRPTPGGGDGDGDERPETCEPDELGENYPLDPPLPIEEVCDGVDNNCDGNVDVTFCERISDCPRQSDPEGFALQRTCEEGVCEYYASNRFACPDPIPCVDGAFEIVPPDCQ